LSSLRSAVSQAVGKLPAHQEFIERYCKASHAAGA